MKLTSIETDRGGIRAVRQNERIDMVLTLEAAE
jgi:hypothetical protein